MSLLKFLYCFQSADKNLKCLTVAQRPCVIWPLPTSAARSALSSLMAPPAPVSSSSTTPSCLPRGHWHLLMRLPENLFLGLNSHLLGFSSNIPSLRILPPKVGIHGECETQMRTQSDGSMKTGRNLVLLAPRSSLLPELKPACDLHPFLIQSQEDHGF